MTIGLWTTKARQVRMGMVALAVAGALAACGGSGNDEQGKPLDVTILHINDHHSTLESRSKTLKLNAGGAAAVDVAVDAGAFPA